MKVAIVSDFHLGYARFEDDAFKQAREAFAKAVEFGDVIILAGDLFDSKIPKPETLSQAFEIFEQAKKKEWKAKKIEGTCCLPVVCVHGTHERRGREFVNPIQTLEAAGFLNNAHEGRIVFELNGETIAVQGLGGVPDDYAKAALEKKNFTPIQSAFNVFAFHQTLAELVPAAKDLPGVEDLPEGFDAYACGHFHARKTMQAEGKLIIIPGSTVVTQMKKEEEEAKGFYLLDTKTKKTEFVKINSRQFHFLELKLDNATVEDARKKILAEIERVIDASTLNPIIRLKVSGTLAKGLEPSNLAVNGMEREFSGRAHVEIDKQLSSDSLKEKIDFLRSLRGQKATVREMGLTVLKEKLKASGSKLKPEQAEELFDSLCEGSEQALKKLVKETHSKAE
ncbi:metallophosphoesterase family protein [Candidatus Micrarchaeota archaeon]|nr:metallophosphoesterase family protein [Candidatus Micrarchaeota archaeon]